MVSTFTPNIQIEEPARGDDVGVWDTPVNSNSTLLDLVCGGTATIGLNNANVVLSAAQFQCQTIVFNSTLTGSVSITFPTSFSKNYTIWNRCTGSSAFTITLTTSTLNGFVCPPPGTICEIMNFSAGSIQFRDLPPVGTYWDYAGSSVPAWVTGTSPQPWIICDGTAFSSASFPILLSILGGTTTPDARGRFRATLNQTTGRITSGTSTGGIDGNTLLASGGSQITTLSSVNMPPIPVTDPGHTHTVQNNPVFVGIGNATPVGGGNVTDPANSVTLIINSAQTGITVGNAAPTNFSNLPPAYVGGITMIRAG